MKALFIILPEKGHINPYIGPAQALQNQSYSVLFAAPGDISAQLSAAGLDFIDDLVRIEATEQPMRGKELVQLINNKSAMNAWIKSLLLNISSREVQKIRNIIRHHSPQVIIIDPLYYAGVIAAELEKIPWVSMSNSLNPILEEEITSDLLETLEEIKEDRSKIFASFNVEMHFKGCDAISKHLTIAFCTEEFVGKRSDVQMVGPSLPLRSRGDEIKYLPETTLPIVYASFGSQIYHWPLIFKNLIKATRNLNIKLILSVGDLKEEALLEPEDKHVTLFKYAPQLEILKSCELFITHGGANSVMEAIANGTSRLWITPMCNDQFHQAYYIKKSGIGLTKDIQVMTATEIREKIITLLSDQKMKETMKKINSSYQVNGSIKAAELIRDLQC